MLNPPELDALLLRARRRDAAALTALAEAYSARLYGLLVRLTSSRVEAEDLVQETLLRVIRTIEDYDHQGRFEAWLFRIAANLARDYRRRQRRRGLSASLSSVESDEGGGSTERVDPRVIDGETMAMNEESHGRLAACLAGLTDADREILLLRHYGDLSFREIADLLGVPLGTALARAHRAVARLRQRLEGEE